MIKNSLFKIPCSAIGASSTRWFLFFKHISNLRSLTGLEPAKAVIGPIKPQRASIWRQWQGKKPLEGQPSAAIGWHAFSHIHTYNQFKTKASLTSISLDCVEKMQTPHWRWGGSNQGLSCCEATVFVLSVCAFPLQPDSDDDPQEPDGQLQRELRLQDPRVRSSLRLWRHNLLQPLSGWMQHRRQRQHWGECTIEGAIAYLLHS